MPTFEREIELHRAGFARVAGADEAGRGPLAGPVVGGAAVLTREFVEKYGAQLNDSKKISPALRAELNEIIRAECAWGIGIVSASEIDEFNIRVASWEAMRRAVEDLEANFPEQKPGYLLIDGLACREIPLPWATEAVVKGDAKVMSIAAAAILAKVARDKLMDELDKEFPNYEFARHKGYPTKAHFAALKEFGPCEAHRRSFGPVKAMLED